MKIYKLLFLSALMGCNPQNHFHEPSYNDITQITPDEFKFETSNIVIIPINGCSPCVSSTLKYLEKQIKSDSQIRHSPNIVFTHLSDDSKFNESKINKLKTLYPKKLFIDSLDLFDDKLFGYFNQAPVLIDYDNSAIKGVFILKKENYRELIDLAFSMR
jgi:hypothetical protein